MLPNFKGESNVAALALFALPIAEPSRRLQFRVLEIAPWHCLPDATFPRPVLVETPVHNLCLRSRPRVQLFRAVYSSTSRICGSILSLLAAYFKWIFFRSHMDELPFLQKIVPALILDCLGTASYLQCRTFTVSKRELGHKSSKCLSKAPWLARLSAWVTTTIARQPQRGTYHNDKSVPRNL